MSQGVTTDVAAAPASARGRAAALIAVCLGFFMVLLDGSALNVALPAIGRDVGGSTADLQWLVNAYTVPLAALLLSAGALSDRLGPRRVFVWSLTGFVVTSLICAVSPTMAVFVIARILQGVAAAGVLPTTLAIIVRGHPDAAARAKAIAWWGGTGGLALAIGPLGGGALTEYASWRAIFLMNVPIGVVAVVLARLFVADFERHGGRRLDLAGQLLGGLALASVVGCLIEGGARGWSDPVTVASGAVGAVALLSFIAVEHRTAAPMLPLGVFLRPAFSAAVVSALAFQFGAYGVQFMLALVLQDQWHFSAVRNAAVFLPLAIAWTFANLWLNRRWSARGMRWLVTRGGAVAAVGAVVAQVSSPTPAGLAALLVGTALIGLGSGLLAPSCNAAPLITVDPRYTGLASGILNTARQIGMALAIALLGVLAASGVGVHVGLALVAVCFVAVVGLGGRYLKALV